MLEERRKGETAYLSMVHEAEEMSMDMEPSSCLVLDGLSLVLGCEVEHETPSERDGAGRRAGLL